MFLQTVAPLQTYELIACGLVQKTCVATKQDSHWKWDKSKPMLLLLSEDVTAV